MDEQEAETSTGEPLGPLIDNGLETELLEEYRDSWAGHTAANDDYLGHPSVSYMPVSEPSLGRGGRQGG
jgi:hypothetical protein